MFHPTFVKYYALAVSAFSAVMLVMFLSIAGLGMWYIANPVVTELKDFTYEKATGSAMKLGLKPENAHLFQKIDMEDFMKRPEYYYNIAKLDHATRIPEITIQTMACSLIFLIGLIMHLKLWKRMRGLGA